MAAELRYTTFNTKMGWLGILDSEKGLLAITLPQPSREQALKQLGDDIDHAAPSPAEFNDLTTRLELYFEGHEVDFGDRLDLSGATLFQGKVWHQTRLIPYGETRSYAWVAEQLGQPKAVRAVGQALAGNPLPIIIPCHRILSGDGRLGGYSGGLEMKLKLLKLEASTKRGEG